jgi:hypothetical protein
MMYSFDSEQNSRDNYELKDGGREQGGDKMLGKKYIYTNAIIEPVGLNKSSE